MAARSTLRAVQVREQRFCRGGNLGIDALGASDARHHCFAKCGPGSAACSGPECFRNAHDSKEPYLIMSAS